MRTTERAQILHVLMFNSWKSNNSQYERAGLNCCRLNWDNATGLFLLISVMMEYQWAKKQFKPVLPSPSLSLCGFLLSFLSFLGFGEFLFSHLVSLPPAWAVGGVWRPCGGTSSEPTGRRNRISPTASLETRERTALPETTRQEQQITNSKKIKKITDCALQTTNNALHLKAESPCQESLQLLFSYETTTEPLKQLDGTMARKMCRKTES